MRGRRYKSKIYEKWYGEPYVPRGPKGPTAATIVSHMPDSINCPRCGVEIPSNIRCCWRCGFRISSIHENCPCGRPVGHGRHRVSGRLVFSCGCGFAATTKREIDRHLEEVR